MVVSETFSYGILSRCAICGNNFQSKLLWRGGFRGANNRQVMKVAVIDANAN